MRTWRDIQGSNHVGSFVLWRFPREACVACRSLSMGLVGREDSSEEITARYVSPLACQDCSCSKLRVEINNSITVRFTEAAVHGSGLQCVRAWS